MKCVQQASKSFLNTVINEHNLPFIFGFGTCIPGGYAGTLAEGGG